ncbi:MAG TPA: CHAT domain-containing tetratricopeptide repeat protein [Acetobacteraceae bacterium]|nr:CHAT domain-containing tetratricopeptide repeat protein [Acetobacteraceae bacterium]
MAFPNAVLHSLLLWGMFALLILGHAAQAQAQRDWVAETRRELDAGQAKAALASAEQGIRALEKSSPVKILPLLLEEAQAYEKLGDFHSREGALNRATAILRRAVSLDNPGAYDAVGFVFLAAGRTAMDVRDVPTAIGHLEAYLQLAKAAGKSDDDVSGALVMLGVLYQDAGRLQDAAQILQRGLVALQRSGQSDDDAVPALRALAETYDALGQIQKGGPYAIRLVALLQKRIQANPQNVDYYDIQTLLEISPLLRKLGRFDTAEGIYLQALDLYSRNFADRQGDVAIIRLNLGSLYDSMGREDAAEAEYKKAIALAEQFHDNETLETVLSNLGDLYRRTSRTDEAIATLKRALDIIESDPANSNPVGHAEALVNYALALLQTGQFDRAAPYAEKSLAILQQRFPSGHYDIGSVLQALSDVRRQQGRLKEALEINQRIIDEKLKVVGADHEDVARAYNNRGMLFSDLGDHAQALDYLAKAAAIWDRKLPNGHDDRISSHTNLAFELLRLGRREAAVREARLGAEQAAAAMRTASQARASPKAFDLWIGAFELFLASRYDAAANRQPIPPEAFEMAQWATSSDAAWALQQMSVRQADGAADLQQLIRKRQDLVSERDQVGYTVTAALSSPAPDSTEAATQPSRRMLEIDAELKTLDATIAQRFPRFADLALPLPASLTETAVLLRDNEALVLIVGTRAFPTLPGAVHVFVVTRTASLWGRSELAPDALVREVQTLRCGLDEAAWRDQSCATLTGHSYTAADRDAGRRLPFDHARAYKLYQALFGKMADLIKGRRLLIVPSGPLTELPFQTLITAPPQSDSDVSAAWLVRDHALTVLPAASSLRALRVVSRPSAATKQMIGFGNPLLDGDPNNPDDRKDAVLALRAQSCAGPTHGQLWLVSARGTHRGLPPIATGGTFAEAAFIRAQAPLPETAEELCAVARALRADPDDIRLGARATVREVEALSESGRLVHYRIVMFATHGALAGQITGSNEPGLILTPPAEPSKADAGYLAASAIAGLKLDADWVILSACNTAAGGARSAEALSGIARAFIYAQARGLLVSHWEVDSDAAVKLITGTMSKLTSNPAIGYAEALRQSMLALIDDGVAEDAQPSYWAPFIVVGEGGASH